MGYFSNGIEGDIYRDRYCNRCANDGEHSCAIWEAHLMYNYDECNNKHSILHFLIPRGEDGNEQCKMFRGNWLENITGKFPDLEPETAEKEEGHV